MHKYKFIKLGEEGFAPIIVSIIIIIVLSLLTIGFIYLAESSQKTALNSQLSNDAYYAAESGINDAIEAIANGYVGPKTNCGPLSDSQGQGNNNGVQYLDNNYVDKPYVYYSCLLINSTPSSLQYSSIGQNQPSVVLLSTINAKTKKPESPKFIEFSWQPSPQSENSPYTFAPNGYYAQCSVYSGVSGPCFPPSNQWVTAGKPITGVLRIALTPLINSKPLPTNTATTLTAFLYPDPSSDSNTNSPQFLRNNAVTYSKDTIGVNSGMVLSGNCNNGNQGTYAPDACNVVIDLSQAHTDGYILSMRSIYLNSQVTIQAFSANGNLLEFKNSQTVIDSTGDDHGVLRRIQVRIPTLNDTGFPAYDLASGNTICKDLSAWPTNITTGNPGGVDSSCSL
ncbi:PilX N-terminal domain-containing pilus assembly protein [Patescibacteria group bacterium]|jgi:hypothetical protein|nr:PilX N-terminal domain-containing pilus assembly protein [Patescibacteria group bacterium]